MKTMSVRAVAVPSTINPSRISVHLRILYDRSKSEFTTGLNCQAEEWDADRELFKTSSHLNQRLSELREKAYRAKNELDDMNRNYIAMDIKDRILGKDKASIELLEFFEEFLLKKEKDSAVRNSTS